MNLSQLPIQKFFDNNGKPLDGGQLFTYVSGTTTKIATYKDQAGTLNSNPIALDYRGEANVWLDQTLTYKFTLAPVGDTDPPTKPIWTVDNISAAVTYASLTQQIIGQILYPRTAAEIAAGVTPVNYWYAPGYVDRYGINTTHGSTDMAPAFNAAYLVASGMGCSVRWGATAPYRLASPVNCTGYRGIVSYDESSGNSSNDHPSIIIDHQGLTNGGGAAASHGFDLSCSTEMVFHDMVPKNGSGKVPDTLFFMARNAAGSGAGQHRFYNIHTPSSTKFKHVFYNYASEENVLADSILYNSQGGSSILNHNAKNPSGFGSLYQTIATGDQSNVGHHVINTHLFQEGNSGSANEVCIALERTGNFNWVNGLAHCPNGLAYISVGGTVGSNFLSLKNIRGETDGAATTTAGILVRCSAATGADQCAHWVLDNVAFNTGGAGYLLNCNSTSDLADLHMRACFSNSGNHALVHSVSYSIIAHGQQVVTGLAGGTVQFNQFIGNRANVTLVAGSVPNAYIDQTLGQGGFDGIKFPATQVTSSDANTLDDYEEGTYTPSFTLGGGSVTYTTQTGSYTKVGRLVTAQGFIAINTVSIPSGALKVAGLPFTSSAGLKGAVSLYYNSFGAVATPIVAFVDASATTFSLFKIVAGSAANLGGDVGSGTQLGFTATYEV